MEIGIRITHLYAYRKSSVFKWYIFISYKNHLCILIWDGTHNNMSRLKVIEFLFSANGFSFSNKVFKNKWKWSGSPFILLAFRINSKLLKVVSKVCDLTLAPPDTNPHFTLHLQAIGNYKPMHQPRSFIPYKYWGWHI